MNPPNKAKRTIKTLPPEVQVVLKITGASLRTQALKVQEDIVFLLLPRLMEKLHAEACLGKLGTVLRMDQLIEGEAVCPVEAGRAVCRELAKLGIASQLAKMDDDRRWERLVIEVSWKEGVEQP